MKQLFIALLITLISNGTQAQNFQGIATYKTKRKVDLKLDSTQVNSEMYQNMLKMLEKRFEKTFILTFDKEASVYKEEEQLEAPQPAGMRMMVVNAGGSDILYKNIKDNRFASQNEVFGKVFLVKDELEKLDWTLENETKNIGDYTCYKATRKRMIEVVESGVSFNGDKDLDKNEAQDMKEITITAWYTSQIPVNSGPAKSYGLPGLILEVNDGQETIICSKIVLNPKERISIDEPKKGKVVTQKDFETIVEKKAKEERERYENNRDGDGESIEIRIGG